MSATLIPLSVPQALGNGTVRIGTVTEVDKGTATRIAMVDSPGDLSPAGQLSHVPALTSGDSVVVADSTDGPIVIGKLKTPDQPAAATVSATETGVVIDAPEGIRLQCGNVTIALSADGRVSLSGDRVIAKAGTELQLNGSSIRIN